MNHVGYQKRREHLISLRSAVVQHKKELLEALKTDLGKSETEAYMTEVGFLLSDISYTLRHLRKWMRPKHVGTPITNFAARCSVMKEPYGKVLIIAPWNYPVLLALQPLVGALAAGNTAVIKPSELSPASSSVVEKVIHKAFCKEIVDVVQGGPETSLAMLAKRWDYIFYTGSPKVGRIVMEAASKNLTPVTLELGGKSPVIVDHSANLRLAARRIVFGKYLNCGQTCIAPDYVMVETTVHDELIAMLKEEASTLYPDGCGKIINHRHFDRLMQLTDHSKVVYGGKANGERLTIEPTIIDNVDPVNDIMQEEIFGPLLPIMTVNNIDEAIRFVNSRPKPLALYLFTNDKKVKRRVLYETSFGGGCVNDTIMHISQSNMPFGGVGESGMGAYHGRWSFDTFSHEKSVVDKATWIDTTMRYPPYTNLKNKLIHKFLK